MPWSDAWSGLANITASSVAVIGTATELDLNTVNNTAAVIFKDLSGNNAQEGLIFSQRIASTNTMAIEIYTSDAAQVQQGFILVEAGDIQIQSFGATPTDVATLELHTNRLDVNGEVWVSGETWHALTLAAGWSQIAGYLPISYRQTPDNKVEFRGTIHNGTNADNTQIATMPVGYRPVANALLRPPVGPSGAGNVGSSRIFITSAGGVFIYGMTGVTDIGFDGLEYSLDT